MASTVTKIVDPDNGGGTDYTSLDAWEDALGGTNSGDLPTDDEIAVAQCRSSGGTDDTTAVEINGWTTDATRYIEIIGTDFPSNGVYDGTKYVLHNNDTDAYILTTRENYVRVRKIQVLVTETSTNNRRGMYFWSQASAANSLIVDSCIIKGVCSGTGQAIGLRVNDADSILNVYNTIIYDFVSGANAVFIGGYIDDCAAVNFYNCTIYGNYAGIYRVGGTVTAKNCAVGNNTDDFNGTIIMDYIVSDDDHSGDCSNYHAFPTNGANDWSLDFATPGSDFTLLATAANLIDDGLADLFTEDDDIIDTARPQGAAWDIGAFEYVSVAGAAGIMTTNTGYWGPTF